MKKIILSLIVLMIVGCNIMNQNYDTNYNYLRQCVFDSKQCNESIVVTIESDKKEIYSFYNDGTNIKDIILVSSTGNLFDWDMECIYY